MGFFARGISQQFSSFHNIDGPNLCLPTQFFCVKSKVRPVEHSQTKLPRVLRQIPFLHKPGNWVHSSMSANQIQRHLPKTNTKTSTITEGRTYFIRLS